MDCQNFQLLTLALTEPIAGRRQTARVNPTPSSLQMLPRLGERFSCLTLVSNNRRQQLRSGEAIMHTGVVANLARQVNAKVGPPRNLLLAL